MIPMALVMSSSVVFEDPLRLTNTGFPALVKTKYCLGLYTFGDARTVVVVAAAILIGVSVPATMLNERSRFARSVISFDCINVFFSVSFKAVLASPTSTPSVVVVVDGTTSSPSTSKASPPVTTIPLLPSSTLMFMTELAELATDGVPR